MTTTMKAAILDAAGAPFRVTTMARPTAGPGQVLVRIHASGVNPLDTKIRSGQAAHARHPLPAILGIDVAGTVAATGTGVTRFAEGDEVYGMTGGVGGVQGSLAEYAAVDAELLAKKPKNLSMRDAASLPLVVITAWEGLIDRAAVRAGHDVLVQGAAGGVGQIVLQLAKARGARTVGVDSAAKKELLEQRGAVAVDYRAETPREIVANHTAGRGFDIVYDTVGGTTLDASFEEVCRFGHVVSILGWGTHALAPLSFRAATYSGVFTLLPLITGEGRAHHGEILRAAAELVETGQVVPQVDPRRFTLETVGDAYEILGGGHPTQGKLVVDIDAH